MLSLLDSTSHVIQLLVALSLAIVLFVAAFSGYGRALFLGLLVMIPFQPIDSKYGSINMVVTWLVGISVWLDSFRHRSAGHGIPPMVWQFGLLVLVFFMSVALAPSHVPDEIPHPFHHDRLEHRALLPQLLVRPERA